MRVSYDNRWRGQTGIGRYLQEIVIRKPEHIELQAANVPVEIRNPFAPLYLSRSILTQKPDLFWSPGFIPPAWCSCPFVFTIHDLIYLEHGSLSQRLYFQSIIKLLAKRARTIVTVSDYVRTSLIRWLNIPENRIIRIYNGVDSHFSSKGPHHNLGKPYFLYIGNRRKHKNLYRMLQAFAYSNLPPDILLVLSGNADKEISSYIHRLKIGDYVRFLGPITEEKLPDLYRGALGLVLVSLSEGFGLPAAEAMACGTPVIGANSTALPEIIGDGGMLVNPTDVEEIAEAMRLMADQRQSLESMRHAAIERATMFDWKASAEQIWNLITDPVGA